MVKSPVVVVAGGAGLIGSSLSRGIAESGAVCVIADVDAVRATALANTLNAEGLAVEALGTDLSCAADVDELVTHVRDRWGTVDSMVNCSYPKGSNFGHGAEDVAIEDFLDTIRVHLAGFFEPARRFGRLLADQGHGSVVNVTSIYGQFAPEFALYTGTSMTVPIEYAVAKAGINQMTRYLAQYYKKSGVRFNAVSPGGVRDGQPRTFADAYDAMAGSRGLLQPSDLVGTVRYLISDASKYMTGQVLVVDDGWSL